MTAALIGDPPLACARPRPLVLVVHTGPGESLAAERTLQSAGYRVERAASGQPTLTALQALVPDLVVLDLANGPHGENALDLARAVRAQSDTPILILSADQAVDARVAGLDAGADDYLIKPFATEELLARSRALLRGRALAAARAVADLRRGPLAYAEVRLDQDLREAFRGTRRLGLRNKAFELLACFLRHPERVLSRRELLEEVWGYDFLGDSNVIEVTVGHLRQALEAGGDPRLIHTVRPVGYIMRTSHGSRGVAPAQLSDR